MARSKWVEAHMTPNELVSANRGLIRAVFNHYYGGAAAGGRGVDGELRRELYDAGWYGLAQAAMRFDPSKGVKVETYAWHRIHGAMLNACAPYKPVAEHWDDEPADKPSVAPIDALLDDYGSLLDRATGTLDEFRTDMRRKIAHDLLEHMGNDMARMIVCARLGIDGQHMTYRELADATGLTVGKIQRLQRRAMQELREALDRQLPRLDLAPALTNTVTFGAS